MSFKDSERKFIEKCERERIEKIIKDLKIDDDFHEYYKEHILGKDDNLIRVLECVLWRIKVSKKQIQEG